MKILLAHNNYTVQGGAEVFYREVGRLLEAHGHKVARFSCAEEGLAVQGAEYFPPAADYRSGNVLTRAARLPAIIYNQGAKAAMARLIADFRPDIIHAFAIYVRLTPAILDAAREAGVPVVLSCNDYKHICPNYKLFHHGRLCEECKGGRFYHALINKCCHGSITYSAASTAEAYVHDWLDVWRKNVSCFLFASDFMARKTEEFWGERSFCHETLPNPFDSKAHRIDGPVGDYGLYFGRLIEEKGVDVLLDVAAQVPQVPLVIIGDGPDRDKVERRAADLTNVRFLGPKWGDELNDWLRAARVVVVPSLWYENFPYVIFQAFAAGKPVLGTNRGGIPELIENGVRGWIYEATDVAAFADGLRHVFSLPNDTIAAMGQAARQYVEDEFNDGVFYERLMEIYAGVLL